MGVVFDTQDFVTAYNRLDGGWAGKRERATGASDPRPASMMKSKLDSSSFSLCFLLSTAVFMANLSGSSVYSSMTQSAHVEAKFARIENVELKKDFTGAAARTPSWRWGALPSRGDVSGGAFSTLSLRGGGILEALSNLNPLKKNLDNSASDDSTLKEGGVAGQHIAKSKPELELLEALQTFPDEKCERATQFLLDAGSDAFLATPPRHHDQY